MALPLPLPNYGQTCEASRILNVGKTKTYISWTLATSCTFTGVISDRTADKRPNLIRELGCSFMSDPRLT